MTAHAEVLVIGAGPAGLAAATASASAGAKVTVLDDNPATGGQIWRSSVTSESNPRKARALGAFASTSAVHLPGRRVIDAPAAQTLRAFSDSTQTLETFTWDRLILATGARERFLPFPGWTLPGVFGAGGLQALVQGGFPVSGKRIVVAGTGPLLLAVAAHLEGAGAEIVTIAEQAHLSTLLPFAASLLATPARLLQGFRYKTKLALTPYRIGTWVTAVEGTDRVEAVVLTDGAKTWTEPCDFLACGFHLVPNTELPALLGCAFVGDFIEVDRDQRTSVANIFCAGDPTGIAGLDAALLEGEIAGLVAAGRPNEAIRLHPRRDREKRFGEALARGFALRPELSHLALPETLVCRCEDVPYSQLQPHSCWTDAKLQTRCGMGPCQGRICGPATQNLFGWRNTSIRPPLFPVPLSALAAEHLLPISQETP